MTNATQVIPSMSLDVPGVSHALIVQFPNGNLPACSSCNRNGKTKRHCRIQKMHVTPPGTEMFICISIGQCLEIDCQTIVEDNDTAKGHLQFMTAAPQTVQVCTNCNKNHKVKSWCRKDEEHLDLPHSSSFHKVSGLSVIADEDDYSDFFRVQQSDINSQRSFLCHVSPGKKFSFQWLEAKQRTDGKKMKLTQVESTVLTCPYPCNGSFSDESLPNFYGGYDGANSSSSIPMYAPSSIPMYVPSSIPMYVPSSIPMYVPMVYVFETPSYNLPVAQYPTTPKWTTQSSAVCVTPHPVDGRDKQLSEMESPFVSLLSSSGEKDNSGTNKIEASDDFSTRFQGSSEDFWLSNPIVKQHLSGMKMKAL